MFLFRNYTSAKNQSISVWHIDSIQATDGWFNQYTIGINKDNGCAVIKQRLVNRVLNRFDEDTETRIEASGTRVYRLLELLFQMEAGSYTAGEGWVRQGYYDRASFRIESMIKEIMYYEPRD